MGCNFQLRLEIFVALPGRLPFAKKVRSFGEFAGHEKNGMFFSELISKLRIDGLLKQPAIKNPTVHLMIMIFVGGGEFEEEHERYGTTNPKYKAGRIDKKYNGNDT